VAAAPHRVSGRRASRSFASLGKLGTATLGSAADASVLGAALASAGLAAAEGAAWDAAPALGIGVAAAPQPHSTTIRAPATIGATVVRRNIRGLLRRRPDGDRVRRTGESSRPDANRPCDHQWRDRPSRPAGPDRLADHVAGPAGRVQPRSAHRRPRLGLERRHPAGPVLGRERDRRNPQRAEDAAGRGPGDGHRRPAHHARWRRLYEGRPGGLLPVGPDLRAVALGAIGLGISRTASFALNFVGRSEYLQVSTTQQMFAPYGRLLILHLTILFGAFVSLAIGSPVGAIVVLVLVKTAIDLGLHVREHAATRDAEA